MITCNNCFHKCVCPLADGAEYRNIDQIRDDCEYFTTSDVVPKSEVESIITEIADFIWQGESEKMNFPFNNHYYNKQEFIAELKKKYTEVDDAGK